jgi:Protein of unknown function (DUF2666)
LEEPDEYIDFMAKYKEWISIRRLGIREKTTPQEVVYHLAGIRTVIDAKALPLLGIKGSLLDSFAKSVTEGLKKKAADLSVAVAKLDSPDAKKAIDDSCDNKVLTPIAKAYLLNKIISNLGFETGVDQLSMSKIFPELKPPKAPGMGRKKKAASGDAL